MLMLGHLHKPNGARLTCLAKGDPPGAELAQYIDVMTMISLESDP